MAAKGTHDGEISKKIRIFKALFAVKEWYTRICRLASTHFINEYAFYRRDRGIRRHLTDYEIYKHANLTLDLTS
jgi:hypothetical protein